MENIRTIEGHTVEFRAGIDGFCTEINGVQVSWDESYKVEHARFLSVCLALSNRKHSINGV